MTSTYDEMMWDDDDDAAPATAAAAVAPTPPGQQGEVKFHTLEIPFSVERKNGNLLGKTALEFSVKNKALVPENIRCSNQDEFESYFKSGLLQNRLVSKVSMKNLHVTGFTQPLLATFKSINTISRKTFGGIPTPAQAANSKSSPVAFLVTPGKEQSGSFDANLSPDTIDHFAAHSDVSKEKVRQTYGQVGDGRLKFVNFNSPILHTFTPEQHALLKENEKFGFHEYLGEFAELKAAEDRFWETHESNIAYSDLSLNNFGVELSVPATNVYNDKTEEYEMKQNTFYDLALKAGGKSRPLAESGKYAARPDAKGAYGDFDNQVRVFSGVIVVHFQ